MAAVTQHVEVNGALVLLSALKLVSFLTLTFCCPVIVIAHEVYFAQSQSACDGSLKNALPHLEHLNMSVSTCCIVVSVTRAE